MGCTSSKKRTTSIDDLTGQKKDAGAPGDAAASKKNGQVTANDKPIMRDTAKLTGSEAPDSGTKAIQIPGAHKSFLAPDGIPFIDEDVDDELESGGTTRVVTAKADVNKNVVVASPPRPVVAAVTPVAPPVAKPPTEAQIQQQEEEDRKRAVAADILRQELDITSPEVHVQPTAAAAAPATHSEHHEPTVEEQQKAAVKIQAGIRGYRDRQKVKAIRAAKEHPSNGPDTAHAEQAEHHEHHEHTPEEDAAIKIQASYKGFKARQQVKEMKEHGEHGQGDSATSTIVYNEHHTEDHLVVERPADHPPPSPEMERAATKIQASYKGYKTRKELGRLHHTEDN